MYRGSLFTRSLVDYLDRRRTERLSWDELLRDVSVVCPRRIRSELSQWRPDRQGPRPAERPECVRRQLSRNAQDQRAARRSDRPRLRRPGALIIRVDPDSPSTKVFDLKARRYTSLQSQQVIRTANGRAVKGAAEFIEITKGSPQVMRIEAGTSRRGWREYLIRLKY